MLLSLRKNGLTSLFKEVRVFKVLLAAKLRKPGRTKSTVKVGLLEYRWSLLQIYSKRSDNRTLACQNPQRVAFEELCLEAQCEIPPISRNTFLR